MKLIRGFPTDISEIMSERIPYRPPWLKCVCCILRLKLIYKHHDYFHSGYTSLCINCRDNWNDADRELNTFDRYGGKRDQDMVEDIQNYNGCLACDAMVQLMAEHRSYFELLEYFCNDCSDMYHLYIKNDGHNYETCKSCIHWKNMRLEIELNYA